MVDQSPARRFSDNQWHLDKRVPVALILTLGIQMSVGIWWAAAIDERQSALTLRVARLEIRDDKIADQMSAIESRLARVEANGEAQLKALERIYLVLRSPEQQ
jgi:hypothetical protein